MNLKIRNTRNSIDFSYSLVTRQTRVSVMNRIYNVLSYHISFIVFEVCKRNVIEIIITSRSVINYNFKRLHRFVIIVLIHVKIGYKNKSRILWWILADSSSLAISFIKTAFPSIKNTQNMKKDIFVRILWKKYTTNSENSVSSGVKFPTDQNYYTYHY